MGRKLIINALPSIHDNKDISTLKAEIESGLVSHVIRFVDGHEYEYRVGLVNIFGALSHMVISSSTNGEKSNCEIYADTSKFITTGYSETIPAFLLNFVDGSDNQTKTMSTSIGLGYVWDYIKNKEKEDIEQDILASKMDSLVTGHGSYKVVTASPIVVNPIFQKDDPEYINCVSVSSVNGDGTVYCIEPNMVYEFIHSPNCVRPVRMKYVRDVVVVKYKPHTFYTINPGEIVYSKNRTVKHLVTSVDVDGMCVSDIGHITFSIAIDKLTDKEGNPLGIFTGNKYV